MNPDFSKYSLALIKGDKIIYSSTASGLRPLVDCLAKNKQKNCTLHDKVIGLAAAKLAHDSGMIDLIVTNTISRPAKEYLVGKIDLIYNEEVENILDKERKSVCPMEKNAMNMDEKEFLELVDKTFNAIQ